MGLVLIRVRELTRRETREKILLYLYDNRHRTPNEAIIEIIEVDMNDKISNCLSYPRHYIIYRRLKKAHKNPHPNEGI